MAATTEVLPPGNKWEFSERNYNPMLTPGRGVKEILQPQGTLEEIVSHVQGRFIKEDWQFATLVQVPQRIDGYPHLIAVFTHPTRNISVEIRDGDIGQFLKVDSSIEDNAFFNWAFPAEDPINQILKGTNRTGRGIEAGYNAVWVEKETYFWQPGVGFFDMSFPTVEKHISWEDQSIEELMARVRPHQERKAKLQALRVPNPKPLFI